jgi:hypothetical protein
MAKRKRPPDARTPAVKELRAFLVENAISVSGAAVALGMSHVGVLSWLSGKTRPDCAARKRLEKWTAGRVPEELWLSDQERQLIQKQKAFGGVAA